MTTSPSVRIIVPTWNRGRRLLEAIASIQRQDHDNWRITVVDDGSTDETAALLGGLDEPRLRVITSPHIGRPGALRNLGAKGASEDYLAFLDSDDLWQPTKLSSQLAAMAAQPRAGWSVSGFTRHDRHGTRGTTRFKPTESGDPDTFRRDVMALTARVVVPAVMVRRELFEAQHGFDTGLVYCEDHDLWIRLALVSPAALVPQSLVDVRHFADHFPSPQQAVLESWIRVFEKHTQSARSEFRPLIRQQFALHKARLGRLNAIEGHPEALRHAVGAVLWSPRTAICWRLLPSTLYHRTRRGWRRTWTVAENLAELIGRSLGGRLFRPLRSRFNANNETINAACGLKFHTIPDDFIVSQIRAHGLYERQCLEWLAASLRRFGTCLDVGANIGNHSLFLARHFQRVIAIEPSPAAFRYLCDNIALNRATNIIPLSSALSDCNGTSLFYEKPFGNMGSSGFAEGLEHLWEMNAKPEILSLSHETGDRLIARHRVAALDLIKIDVEGHESKVIYGLQAAIERFRPVLVFEWHGQYRSDGDFERVRSALAGYSFFELDFCPPAAGMPAPARLLHRLKYGFRGRLRQPLERPEPRSYPYIVGLSDPDDLRQGAFDPGVIFQP